MLLIGAGGGNCVLERLIFPLHFIPRYGGRSDGGDVEVGKPIGRGCFADPSGAEIKVRRALYHGTLTMVWLVVGQAYRMLYGCRGEFDRNAMFLGAAGGVGGKKDVAGIDRSFVEGGIVHSAVGAADNVAYHPTTFGR